MKYIPMPKTEPDAGNVHMKMAVMYAGRARVQFEGQVPQKVGVFAIRVATKQFNPELAINQLLAISADHMDERGRQVMQEWIDNNLEME